MRWWSIIWYIQDKHNRDGSSEVITIAQPWAKNIRYQRSLRRPVSRDCILCHVWIVYGVGYFGGRPVAKYWPTNNVLDRKRAPEKSLKHPTLRVCVFRININRNCVDLHLYSFALLQMIWTLPKACLWYLRRTPSNCWHPMENIFFFPTYFSMFSKPNQH
jgi:hypothetical protein